MAATHAMLVFTPDQTHVLLQKPRKSTQWEWTRRNSEEIGEDLDYETMRYYPPGNIYCVSQSRKTVAGKTQTWMHVKDILKKTKRDDINPLVYDTVIFYMLQSPTLSQSRSGSLGSLNASGEFST